MLSLLASGAWAHASSGVSTVGLEDSVQPVAPATGSVNPHQAYISRTALSATEARAKMDFEVTLKLRHFDELQNRINRGELISFPEMQARYQPLASDYATVAAWATGAGFQLTRRDKTHMAVFARGTVGQIQQAMDLSFARVTSQGKEYTSAISAPQVPATVASLLVGINGLQPHLRPHKHLILRPNSLTSPNPPYVPSQLAQAYNATGLYSNKITGAGQSIAIVIDTFPATSDLVSFWSTYNVAQSIHNIQFIQVEAGAQATPSGEETLDTEWGSSLAPGAQVRVYGVGELDTNYLDEAYQQVYTDATTSPALGIHEMSMSYGGGETYTTKSQVMTDHQYFAELASAGVSVFASSGDGGSTPGNNSSGDETGSLQVEAPASDTDVTGVGGTSLVLNSSGAESSETVWNNSSGASGGGVSIYFSRPTWQVGVGVPVGTMRLVPDLACAADPNYGAVMILGGVDYQIGGTSWASPSVAGFCALLNEARANAGLGAIGLLNSKIYTLIGTANFRDITSGNNATSNSGGKYAATTGYDEATGVGVPLVQTLAQTLAASTTLIGFEVGPTLQSVAPGQSATFTANASGTPTSYQWQGMAVGSTTWSNLASGGSFSGTTSATLTVSPATVALSGYKFQCLATYGTSTLTSTPAANLVVETPLVVTTFAGKAGTTGEVNATGTAAEFAYPSGVALDSSGNLYVADFNNNAIREITPAGVVTTPYSSPLVTPNAVAADTSNNLYVADTGNNLIRKISGGVISTIGSSATYDNPNGVAVDSSGNVYVADTSNDAIRKITPGGTVTTLAGDVGVAGYVNGTGTAAEFNYPTSVAVDRSGNDYVADFGNNVIRKITSGGVVTTLAGQAGVGGYLDGVEASALFNAPNGVAVDAAGNVYVTDSLIPATTSTEAGNNLFRKITPAGVVSTLAGQAGVTGSANGTGSSAQFYSLQDATVTSGGAFYLADVYNQTIRAAGTGPIITTQPIAQVITAGQAVSFNVAASGTGPFTYQWEKDGTAITGATSATYTIASTSSSNTGGYSAVVTNAFGSATSNSVSLVVATSQPVAQTATAGNSATFSIVLPNTGGPYTYQWLFDGNTISGATGSSYTITDVTSANAGSYAVEISDSYGIVTTTAVSLTVNAAPLATDTPTLPQWGILLLAGALFWVASRRMARTVE
jgi:kumamolisin